MQGHSEMVRYFSRFGSVWLILCGLIVGYLAGVASAPSVSADITEEPRRETFKAGGLSNEPLLREISATLKRIEQRVERIEKNITPPAAAKAQK